MDLELEEECTETAPANFEFYRSTFAGTPIAICTLCDYRITYWECACELTMHECDNEREGI